MAVEQEMSPIDKFIRGLISEEEYLALIFFLFADLFESLVAYHQHLVVHTSVSNNQQRDNHLLKN